jgi:hypothetical protein
VNHVRVVALAVWVVLAGPCPPAAADEAADAFNSLYGKDVKQAKATAGKADDVSLAKELLKAAKVLKGQVGLLGLLCEKAYELAAADAAGYDTAIRAMQFLAERAPEKQAAALGRIVPLRERQYRASRGIDRAEWAEELIQACLAAGEAEAGREQFAAAGRLYRKAAAVARKVRSERRGEIGSRLEQLTERRRVAGELKSMLRRLAANAGDVVARRRLVELYVVEYDQPAEAARLLKEKPRGVSLGRLPGGLSEEALAQRLALAAGKLGDLSEAACLELGEWYRQLAEAGGTTTAAKPKLLARARTYYQQFLGKHTVEDVLAARAELGLKKVEAALARLAPSDAGGWMYLIRTIDLAKHAYQGGYSAGKWRRRADGLASPAGEFEQVMIPVIPKGSYHLRVVLALERAVGGGTNIFAVMLPTEGGHTILEIGPESCHFSIKGDRLYAKVAAGVKLLFRRPYRLDVKVLAQGDQARITVELNRKTVLRWRGPQKELTTYATAWDLPNPKALGIGAKQAHVLVHALRLRMLSGEAEPVGRGQTK